MLGGTKVFGGGESRPVFDGASDVKRGSSRLYCRVVNGSPSWESKESVQ